MRSFRMYHVLLETTSPQSSKSARHPTSQASWRASLLDSKFTVRTLRSFSLHISGFSKRRGEPPGKQIKLAGSEIMPVAPAADARPFPAAISNKHLLSP
ncbi:hypothetical protein NDU88_001968 [Pleurodeles waltl]|uniref:Uncharacterized protein n=1 Tax=Pleurodeles waltl TaxID=8319 RepID=A0AAV7LZJ9_PLEWA|nr:hypothetical protein NDU88_001968 [Pleurodeles waltl]